MHSSLKPDPERKGSYYRRIEDIGRALKLLGVDNLPDAVQFLAYYFACEKLARGIVGIHLRQPAKDAYRHGASLRLGDVQSAARSIGLSVSSDDLAWLFAEFNQQAMLQLQGSEWNRSARILRNLVTHEFGPSNMETIASYARFHNPRMKLFLRCAVEVLAYQRAHFSEIP